MQLATKLKTQFDWQKVIKVDLWVLPGSDDLGSAEFLSKVLFILTPDSSG